MKIKIDGKPVTLKINIDSDDYIIKLISKDIDEPPLTKQLELVQERLRLVDTLTIRDVLRTVEHDGYYRGYLLDNVLERILVALDSNSLERIKEASLIIERAFIKSNTYYDNDVYPGTQHNNEHVRIKKSLEISSETASLGFNKVYAMLSNGGGFALGLIFLKVVYAVLENMDELERDRVVGSGY